jgi:HNH endonuclease
MGSLYLNRLTHNEYQELLRTLCESQHNLCFICEQHIDYALHADTIDIDHIVPLTAGGKDDPINLTATHASCNRSKQASDLRVARLLARFQKLQDQCSSQLGHPNLTDILQAHGVSHFELPIKIKNKSVSYSFPDMGSNAVSTTPLYHDSLSNMDYFFAVIPIAYLTHDDRINPRAISGASLRRLIEEFHSGLPQLHPALAWTTVKEGQIRACIQVFDGQHKAAAQILLGVAELPLRIFINPDMDKLLTANTHAGTTLRQVAFDKSVQRSLGSQLFADRIDR